MWNHFCSSFFVGGRKSGDKGKQYDRAGFEGNEKTVQPRCARGTAPLSAAFAASFPDGQVKTFRIDANHLYQLRCTES